MPRLLTKIGLLTGAGLLAATAAVTPALAGTAPAAPAAAPVQAADQGEAFTLDGVTAKDPEATRSTDTPAPRDQTPTGSPAAGSQTAHLDGVCNVYANRTGDLCLWDLPNYGGGRIDIYVSVPNLGLYRFNPGAGGGASNATESGFNFDFLWTAHGCTNMNYGGVCGIAPPRARGNITPLFRNEVESVFWTL
jgi:hypothetical protein